MTISAVSKKYNISDLKKLRSQILYTSQGKEGLYDEDKALRKDFDNELTGYLRGSDAHRIMKKLNNVKSNPNNKQPRINALFIKLLCLIYLLSQINTQAIITPVNTHHNIVSIFLELNDE